MANISKIFVNRLKASWVCEDQTLNFVLSISTSLKYQTINSAGEHCRLEFHYEKKKFHKFCQKIPIHENAHFN